MVGSSSSKLSKKGIVSSFIFLVGFSLCCFPVISSVYESYIQKDTITTYINSVESSSKEDFESSLQSAYEYNKVLYEARATSLGRVDDILSEDSYNSILNLSGSGVMGSLEIPNINVNLPIYHGVDETSLSNGVGHIQGSSFPVGGENTRSVLTSHRGLPSSKLFTRLDEVDEGDLFFIRVYDNTLAYKVVDVSVISPEDVEELSIKEGKDLVSLLTCTPYGINSHRLVVTGERVEYDKTVHESIKEDVMSYRELLFIGLPFVFLCIFIFLNLRGRREMKSNEKTYD